MLLAAFETSTEWCSVALCRDGEIAALEQRAGQRHAELALPMLARLLAQAGCAAADLDAVAFGAGPGSFTGLRIACGLAQGLALAGDLPVIGVSTLETLAEESGATRVAACLDARMREVYFACLERAATGWRETVAPCCVPPALAQVPPGGGWIGCGSGFSAYAEVLAPRVERVMHGVYPSAAAVARLALPRLAAGQGVDAANAAPIYLRDKVARTVAEQAAAR